MPTSVIQWNGLAAATMCSKIMKITVPASAPQRWPVPPSTSITSASAERSNDTLSSPTTPVLMAVSAPPIPATAPAIAYITTRRG